eukprot:UC1_evm4s2133
MLLEDGKADADKAGPDGTTPLMWAAACGNESVAYFLMQHGCAVEARDSKGQTALLHAVSRGHASITRQLLQHGADKDVVCPSTGNTPLIKAAKAGFEAVVQALLDAGADHLKQNAKGETAAAAAASAPQPSMAIITLLEGAGKPKVSAAELREEAGLGDGLDYVRSSSPTLSPPPLRPSSSNTTTTTTTTTSSQLRSGPSALLEYVGSNPASPVPPGGGGGGGGADELAEFLACLGLQKYLSVFQREEVDFPTLVTMNENDLKAIGLTLFGPRRKIAQAVKRWHEQRGGANMMQNLVQGVAQMGP